MLDHIILTVGDVERSVAFCEVALKPLNIKFFALETRKALPTDSCHVGEADFAEFVVNREGQSFLEA